jgi:RNA polymerase sigma-70 factor (ECF subfamily)
VKGWRRLFSGAINADGPAGERWGVAASALSSPRLAGPAGNSELSPELERAVTVIYQAHHAFVWRNARRLGCSDDWVDDAVHEVFLVVARRLPELTRLENERSWLFAITFRVVQRLLRDRIRQRGHLRRFAQEHAPPSSDTAGAHEATDFLRHALAKLPEPQRLVLILIELEGFTSAEVAQTLGTPVGTVHSRLRAAKQQLARIFEHESQADERPES